MTKDTFWFPHDLEPTSDPKMEAMLSYYGAVGYGIYWRIIEMLHSDKEHHLPFKKFIYLALVKQMQANAKQKENLLIIAEITSDGIEKFIRDCIHEFCLFDSNETHFFVNRVYRNVEKRKNISEVRSISGKIGANAKQKKANAKQILAEEKREEKNIGEDTINNTKVKIQQNGNSKNSQLQGEELFAERHKRHQQEIDEAGKADN